MKEIIKKTNGKKTESLGLLMIGFQLLTIVKPDLFNHNTEKAITFVIGSGVVPTLTHRIVRNWGSISKYIGKKFKWLKPHSK